MQPVIRAAALDDDTAINSIGNWYIENTSVNFDIRSWSLNKRRKWIQSFNTRNSLYHLLVAEVQGQVRGFCFNARFRPKASYISSTETTVYIAPDSHSLGYGTRLYTALLDIIKHKGFHRVYAVITLPNPASVRLHEKLDFTLAGTLDEAGLKFGKYHSIALHQRKMP